MDVKKLDRIPDGGAAGDALPAHGVEQVGLGFALIPKVSWSVGSAWGERVTVAGRPARWRWSL